jgi:hypothetical protein
VGVACVSAGGCAANDAIALISNIPAVDVLASLTDKTVPLSKTRRLMQSTSQTPRARGA